MPSAWRPSLWRVQAVRMQIGGWKHVCVRFTRYNVTLVSIRTGYLVNNPHTVRLLLLAPSPDNHTYPNPRWTRVLPLTRAAIFTAGHWFFHEMQPPPLDQMQSTFTLTRDHLHHSNYTGRALALSFSPAHTRKSCAAATAPLPASRPDAALASVTTESTMPALSAQRRALQESRLRLVDVTKMSRFRPDAHLRRNSGLGKLDCSHWCLPGVPDTWSNLIVSHLLGRLE
ncbi:unnamed protein product [Closterium sp. Naga37s-1]|nr:unnamed protein product [Closterium sp. Naga37s-1]